MQNFSYDNKSPLLFYNDNPSSETGPKDAWSLVLFNPILYPLSYEAKLAILPYVAKVKAQLSPKRFSHVCRVVALADAIARRNHFSQDELALTAQAAILHDIAREFSAEEMYALIPPMLVEEYQCHLTLHGKAGRKLAEAWQVDDGIVLEAIEGHVFGVDLQDRVGMALYVADVSEPGRGVNDDIRELAFNDLKAAYIQAVRCKVNYLKSKAKPVHPDTMRVYRDIEAL
ncbi:MAG: bis(5'-nucleosyl)-tetraphosphatase (symmetrical) YqeK [Deinococcales bacterium]